MPNEAQIGMAGQGRRADAMLLVLGKRKERIMTQPALHEDHLIWIDLEMTGLDPDTDSVLEIATAVTDKSLNVLAEGPEFAIYHDIARLDAMDDWNRNQHRKSGLWQRVLESTTNMATAEAQTI